MVEDGSNEHGESAAASGVENQRELVGVGGGWRHVGGLEEMSIVIVDSK